MLADELEAVFRLIDAFIEALERSQGLVEAAENLAQRGRDQGREQPHDNEVEGRHLTQAVHDADAAGVGSNDEPAAE